MASWRVLGFAVAAFGLLCGATASAQDNDEEVIPTSVDELIAAVGEVLVEYNVPAVGLALVDSSGPVWVGSLGKANLENDIDADENTLYRIGSTSKMFIALSVLKLVEEGRLSLYDKVSDLAPDVQFENEWEATNPVRVVHLLEHTTGWDDIHLPEYAHNDPTPATLKEGLDFHPHSRTSRWQPGTRSSYCNAGPPVAAYIVEKVTGQDFEDYVRENFFEPLGMSATGYRLTDDYREKGATLYAYGNQPQDYWHLLMRPSGAINSSPTDMARFLEFYVNRGAIDGTQIILVSSLARMESTKTTNAARVGQEIGYGLNNYSSSYENWVYRAHGGGVEGGLTDFAYLPEAEVGYVIMINSDAFRALRDISDLVRGYQTRDLQPRAVPEPVPVTGAQRKLAGLYHPINSRQQISYFLDRALGTEKLWFEEGVLKSKPLLTSTVTNYLPAGDALFRSPDTGMVVLSSAEDPLAGPVVHAGDQVLKPVSALVAYGQLGIAALWAIAIVSAVVYFVVWGVRKLRGKVPSGPSTRIRVWPLLASLSIIAFATLFGQGMSDPFTLLGKLTAVSLGVMLLTIAFAVFAVAGSWTAVKERHAEMNRVNYWYSATTSFVHLLVAVYLLWFGVIGIQTWA